MGGDGTTTIINQGTTILDFPGGPEIIVPTHSPESGAGVEPTPALQSPLFTEDLQATAKVEVEPAPTQHLQEQTATLEQPGSINNTVEPSEMGIQHPKPDLPKSDEASQT